MKKLALVVSLVVIFSLLAVGCAPRTQFITVATGGTGGPYNIIGSRMAELLNANIRGVQASATVTTASVVNATMLQEKRADIALAMNDVIFYATSGTEMFTAKHDNIAGIAALYPNFVQVMVRADSPVQTIADLRGRRVGVGAMGSGTEVNARQILAAHGITYNDLRADYLSYAESAEGIRNGTVDAVFLTSGLPNSSIMETATTMDVRFIPIDPSVITELAKQFPFYFSIDIPAGTYRGQTEPVRTAAVTTLLVVRRDLPDTLVYNITKTVFDNLTTLGDAHAAARQISLDRVRVGLPIPMHPGAERYFRGKGK